MLKADECKSRKATDRSPLWRGARYPPGSENGACAYGGGPGTRESLLSPAQEMPEEQGYRLIKSPGVRAVLRPPTLTSLALRVRDTKRRVVGAGTGRERGANRPGWTEVVLAEHSTSEGGEVRPKRPAGGKAKPGMTFATAKHRRDIELTNCVNDPGADCGAVSPQP